MRKRHLLFVTYVLLNEQGKVSHFIHIQKMYVFRFYQEKNVLLKNGRGMGGGGGEDGEGTGLAAPMSPLSIRQGLIFFKEEF